jgi:NhaP-type Na+/H+ or K+/H+ antiporter
MLICRSPQQWNLSHMSEYQILAIIAGFGFLYSLVASRLERTPINGALVYVAFGLLCGPSCLGLLDLDIEGEGIKRLAEFTLAMVLFTDSANANLPVLRRFEQLPARLLLVGLPLTIALGFGAGVLLFDNLTFVEIALLATMLAPTDAALGKAVVTNPAVPDSVREGLNVESGLNDGICVPVLLIFLALAAGSTGDNSMAELIVKLPLQAIGIGVIVGSVFAVVGRYLLRMCSDRGWLAGSWKQIALIALAMLCFATSQRFEGSGFIACFVGGLIFGGLVRARKEDVLAGAEGTGEALSLITWFIFGAAVVGHLFESANWQAMAYAVLSLTLVRMLPVFLVVTGMGLRWDTKLFMGWFGPRGLASIVFIVMVVAEKLPGQSTLASAVVGTILLSVIGHGLTANPLAKIYSERVKARGGAT